MTGVQSARIAPHGRRVRCPHASRHALCVFQAIVAVRACRPHIRRRGARVRQILIRVVVVVRVVGGARVLQYENGCRPRAIHLGLYLERVVHAHERIVRLLGFCNAAGAVVLDAAAAAAVLFRIDLGPDVRKHFVLPVAAHHVCPLVVDLACESCLGVIVKWMGILGLC